METTEDVSHQAKLARVTSPSASSSAEHVAGGDDLISGLFDDLLLQILELVAKECARDAMRTDALSRRWRGLWKRVPALHFDARPAFCSDGGAARFIELVDGALALRAESGDVRHREISMCGADNVLETLPFGIRAATRWIRYALQHRVTSFFFELYPVGHVYYRMRQNVADKLVIALDELPSSPKLETMSLRLVVSSDSRHHFARLLSPESCPRLQKLRMENIAGPNQLLLEAGVLLELTLVGMDLRSMEFRTPNLRVLRVEGCFCVEALTVSTLKLEEMVFLVNSCPHVNIVRGDLSHVRALDVTFNSHGGDDDVAHNAASIYLLQHCSSVRVLTVDLGVRMIKGRLDIIKDRMPKFHHVTSLVVHVTSPENRHSHGPGVKSLLTRFNSLRYLSLQIIIFRRPSMVGTKSLICDHPRQEWKSDDFSLAHLQEAEFRGLTGTECELQFLQVVLASATNVQKVLASFGTQYCLTTQRVDDFRRRLLGCGTWTRCRDACQSYEWRPC
ncbi:hypothetical protein ACP4OV_007906 [Aristida adscensionis]